MCLKCRSAQTSGEVDGSPSHKEPQSVTFAFYLEDRVSVKGEVRGKKTN